MTESASMEFLVGRKDMSEVRWREAEESPDLPLEADEVRLRVDRFSFTTNNITYGRFGELMHYWDFFPAPEGWGRIPVWGFADVVASRAASVREGQRFFGYLPMSPWLRVRVPAGNATEQAFTDTSEHRSQLPAPYQRYQRTERADPAVENRRAVLQPVAGTGFLIADWLSEQRYYEADTLVISSASSKTALATAFHLSRAQARSFEVIGLTSARNRAFCEQSGYYDRVVDYADIPALPAQRSAVFVDLAGDRQVLRGVHAHFGSRLRYSSIVGTTHMPASGMEPAGDLPGPAPQFFFAPTYIVERQKSLGPAAFIQLVREGEAAFYDSSARWLELVERSGRAGIEATYREVLDGRLQPQQGLILRF